MAKKLGGTWSALNKDSKPRDLIQCLKIQGSNPPQYEHNSRCMAELARRYHDKLQDADPGTLDLDKLHMATEVVLASGKNDLSTVAMETYIAYDSGQ